MSKENQESHPSYMDGVRVKIAENYKPPPRITLPMSSSQRLSLNTQIQENIPGYDFALEKTVKDRIKEWRSVRNVMAEERRKRLDKLKESRENEKQERLKSREATPENPSKTYASDREVLIPTRATNVPTSSLIYTGDKSPFNISDFEADTSSPFDNMELKTINEMAELALVLQSDDKFPRERRYEPINAVRYETYNYDKQDTEQNRFSYQSTATSASAYMQPSSSVYTATNGYYYETYQPTYAVPYSYKTTNASFDVGLNDVNLNDVNRDDGKLPFSDVPNIVKALETELTNTHVDHKKHSVAVPNRVPSQRTIAKSELKNPKMEEPYVSLPKNLQELAENISGMGFPLERVARVCKLLGDDNKKIVEHLLVMSDLLDLGFQEGRVSDALVQCNNDRDKALDMLIS